MTSAWVVASRPRHVVPLRLSKTVQSTLDSHCDKCSALRPCFLKSWNSWATSCVAIHSRAFLTLLQLGIP